MALAAAGFTVVELETEDVWLRSNPAIIELLKEVNLPTDNRGDNIFALARKTALIIVSASGTDFSLSVASIRTDRLKSVPLLAETMIKARKTGAPIKRYPKELYVD